MEIVDAHQHLWDVDLFSYSWLQSIPSLNRSFRMADYLQAVEGLNVVQSVHLEADVDEAFMLSETRHLLELADQPDNPLTAIVACGRPESADFRAYLGQIIGHERLKGIRRVLHTQPDTVGQSQIFIDNVASLADYGLLFDVCVLARQLPVAINLASRCSGVTLVLDHCAVPQVKERVLDPWRDHIREMAAFPNVYCKISGLVAYADPRVWTAEDLRPYIEHVIDCFGWDRVLFGSDWPVCTLSASLHQWVETLRFLTKGSGDANQRKLFHDNAVRVYRLS